MNYLCPNSLICRRDRSNFCIHQKFHYWCWTVNPADRLALGDWCGNHSNGSVRRFRERKYQTEHRYIGVPNGWLFAMKVKKWITSVPAVWIARNPVSINFFIRIVFSLMILSSDSLIVFIVFVRVVVCRFPKAGFWLEKGLSKNETAYLSGKLAGGLLSFSFLCRLGQARWASRLFRVFPLRSDW